MADNGFETDAPRLRPVEAFPVEFEGQRHIALRDPLRVCEQTLYVTEFTMHILALLDGAHSLSTIQAELTRRTGDIVPRAALDNLVAQLDQALLLDSPRFRKHITALRSEYARHTMRRPTHAGLSYEADARALTKHLDTLYTNLVPHALPPGAAVRGIVAPHIDISVGGPCFASAFRHLRASDAHLYIILGTGHAYSEHLFTVPGRDFDTPLGPMPVHAGAVRELHDRFGPAVTEDDFNHRNEHSIEFQCVFLRHILGTRNPARILPVYVSSLHELLMSNTPFHESQPVRAMAGALRAIAARQPTCVIAGVDLAHVGLRFDDPRAPDPAMLRTIARKDRELIGILKRHDAPAFFAHFLRDMDARHVCGMSALALFLATLDPGRAAMTGYDQLVEDSGSMVSYTGMVFY